MKTDEAFNNNKYNDFDLGKETILQMIPKFGCVISVPLDYMHLILLGVMKKLITLWLSKPLTVRLSTKNINEITKGLIILKHTTPFKFARKPRSILKYTHWKATEFRTFLLYTGPIVLKGILSDKMYDNFISLHTAIAILVSDKRL